jgi:hypothetical protein
VNRSIWIGYDPRESAAFAVACRTARRRVHKSTRVRGLVLSDLRARGLYTRPTELKPSALDGPVMWDVISDAPMSTEHACARFLVPYLAMHRMRLDDDPVGWAMFADGDVLFRRGLDDVFDALDPRFALYCVKRAPQPVTSMVKMDGQEQTSYARKNWSSVMFFNCDHPMNEPVTRSIVLANTEAGRVLHRFCWLKDENIGGLDPSMNHLVGVDPPRGDAAVVHFTMGTPDMKNYTDCEYSDEWRQELASWAAAGGT